jgi:hypothetical protein
LTVSLAHPFAVEPYEFALVTFGGFISLDAMLFGKGSSARRPKSKQ